MRKLAWSFFFVFAACSPSRQLPGSGVKDSATADCTTCGAGSAREWYSLQNEDYDPLRSIFAIDPNHFYAGGSSFVLEYSSGNWIPHYEIAKVLDMTFGGTVMGIWGDNGESIYAATTAGIAHWDGIEWKKEVTDPPSGFLDIWGLRKNSIFASAAYKHFTYFDGTSWKSFELTDDELSLGNLISVWPVREDWVLFATQGAVYRWDGSKADALFKLDDNFGSVWAADENDVFAATRKTAIRYRNGQLETTPWPINELSNIYRIWGFSSDEVYAVGEGIGLDESLVLRFDGSSWQLVDTGTDIETLFDVTGDKDGNL